jgi:hypothetical protein
MTESTKPSGSPTVFMRGGSSTSSWEQQKNDDKLRIDTARRRAYVDNMKKIAKTKPNEASLHTHKMGTADNNAAIVLSVIGKDSTSQEWEICELNVAQLPDGTPDMTLTLVCPVCAISKNKGHAASQMTLHASNRPFTLDTRRPDEGGVAGTLWVNPTNSSEVVNLAGHITMHGPASCPQCAWKFIIDKNVLRGY